MNTQINKIEVKTRQARMAKQRTYFRVLFVIALVVLTLLSVMAIAGFIYCCIFKVKIAGKDLYLMAVVMTIASLVILATINLWVARRYYWDEFIDWRMHRHFRWCQGVCPVCGDEFGDSCICPGCGKGANHNWELTDIFRVVSTRQVQPGEWLWSPDQDDVFQVEAEKLEQCSKCGEQRTASDKHVRFLSGCNSFCIGEVVDGKDTRIASEMGAM